VERRTLFDFDFDFDFDSDSDSDSDSDYSSSCRYPLFFYCFVSLIRYIYILLSCCLIYLFVDHCGYSKKNSLKNLLPNRRQLNLILNPTKTTHPIELDDL
jgi:hypothetical protein